MTRPERLRGLDAALDAIGDVTPDVAATITGIGAETIRRIARELAAAFFMGTLLFVITFISNSLGQWMIHGMQRRMQGAAT